MANFYSPDPNLIINALRFILEGYKAYRSRKGQKVPEKQEEVLEETVAKAEEMSARGESAETVASQIEKSLERDLGKAAKDEIVGRASSILALARPFEVEAFRYYENLSQVLRRAQDFCASTKIFQLRGAKNDTFSVLPMPQLDIALREVTEDFQILCGELQRAQDVISATTSRSATYLLTIPPAVRIRLGFDLTRARITGGTWADTMAAELVLSPGSEVNKIGFNVARAESPFLRDFEIRITAKEFQRVVSAILDDVNNYVTELGEEQKHFKERLAPQLVALLEPWTKA